MNGNQWERLAPVSGVLYAVFYVVGAVLLLFDAIDEGSDAELVSYFADSGNRAGHIAGFLFAGAGILFLLVFVATLGSRLRRVESEPRILSTLVVGAGVTSAALLLVAASLFASTAFTADELGADFAVDPNAVRLTLYVGFLLLIGAVFTMSVLIASTSVLAIRTAVLPTWVGWLGFVAIVLAVLEVLLLPVWVTPLWAAIVAAVLLVQPPATEPG
jgi:hypothetical protein